MRFSEYAASLFERKVTKRKIRSAKTRKKWESVLRLHLLPAFGDFFLDGIRRADLEGWLERMGKVVQAGRYSPVTVNNWLDILRVIVTSAVEEYELRRHRDHRPPEDLRSRYAGDVRPLQHGPPEGDSGGGRGGHLAREVPRASTGRCIVVGKWWERPEKRNGHPRRMP
jgi:hypothetical protein